MSISNTNNLNTQLKQEGLGKIECVIISIGYADFLQETLPRNVGLFDKILVVTSKDDTATRELCRRYSVQVLLSEDHMRDGEFNKGRLIERGLQHLSAKGWRVHLDADIVLPSNFRNILKSSHLQEEKIYGCDRVMLRSRKEWDDLKNSTWLSNAYHCMVHFPASQIGSRWCHESEGYCPIGFFQMWHSSQDLWNGVRIKPYPINHNDACRTDVQFALLWDRKHRAIIPELIAVHLESEPAKLGANWNGRTTKRF